MRKLCSLLLILSACLLAACGSSTQSSPAASTTPPPEPSPTAATSLKAIDWDNFSYTSTCYGNTQPFMTHNGKAENKFIHFETYQPVSFGDLTGDGQPEAAVRYSCTGADFGGVHVLVYSGTASHPTLLGELPLSDKSEPEDKWSVEKVSIANQVIQMSGRGYSANAPHCCPDLHIDAAYRWDGKQFVSTQFKTTPLSTG
jgi:hypothetical protein